MSDVGWLGFLIFKDGVRGLYTTVRIVNPDYLDVKSPDAVANPTSITLATVVKLYGDARSRPSRH